MDSEMSKKLEGGGAFSVTSLSMQDLNTAVWKRHHADLTRRLQQMIDKICQPMPHEETTLLRGRIAEIKTVLAFADYVERNRATVSQDPFSGYLE